MRKLHRLICILIAVCLSTTTAPIATAGNTGKVGQFQTVSAFEHNMVIKSDGSLWAWGENYCGRLGVGADTDCYEPTKVLDEVVSVATGFGHTLAIKTDGSLWAWGLNEYGQLGDGTTTNRSTPAKVLDNVNAIATGFFYSLAAQTDGSLWAFGFNGFGSLGDGTKNQRTEPTKVMDGVVALASGGKHSLAIKTDGSLWAWGNNERGQLGDGTNTDRFTPVKILDNIIAVAAASDYSMALKIDGSLLTWGKNYRGQLGDGTRIDRNKPMEILNDVADISAGSIHAMVIKTDGSLWGFGDNILGQLGHIPGAIHVEPYKIMDGIATVAGGFQHSIVVESDGNVMVWGYWKFKRTFDIDLPNNTPMSDRPSYWAKHGINTAISMGLAPAFLQSKYAFAITRAEFCALAVVLYNTITDREITERHFFSDTTDENVEMMAALGVVKGTGSNEFSPNDILTREQAAVMLARLSEVTGRPLDKMATTFDDNDQISDWAVESVGQLKNADIMGGVGKNLFSPKSPYTREQSIITMLRMYFDISAYFYSVNSNRYSNIPGT